MAPQITEPETKRAREMIIKPGVVLPMAILILALAMIWGIHKLSRQSRARPPRLKDRSTLQSSRHLLHGSQLLARAKSTSRRPESQEFARTALIEAEKALVLSPKDPSPHILKALALSLLDHHNAALRSLDVALSPPCVRSLSARERGEALVKRAEAKVAVNRRRRVNSAVEDLREAARLNAADSSAYILLGECYEWKGMKREAMEAFQMALAMDPDSTLARRKFQELETINSFRI